MKLRILLPAFFFILFAGGIYFYCSYVAHWSIKTYFNSKGVKAEFILDSFGFKEVSLSDVVLDDSTQIKNIRLTLNGKNLESLKLKLETFDISKVSILTEKLLGPTDKTKKMNYQSLYDHYLTVKPIELNFEINELIYDSTHFPIGLKILHDKNDSRFNIHLEGQFKELSLGENVILDKSNYGTDLTLECLNEEFLVQSKNLNFTITNLKTIDTHRELRNTKLKMTDFIFSLKKDEHVQIKSLGFLESKVLEANKTFAQIFSYYSLDLNTQVDDLKKYQISLASGPISFKNPYPFDVKSFKLNFNFDLKNSIYPSGTFEIKNLTSFSEEKETLFNGIDMTGLIQSDSKKIEMISKISDHQKIINFQNMISSFDFQKNLITLELKGKNDLKINDKISELLPFLKKWELVGKGKVNLSGKMTYLDENWTGQLKVSGQNINLNSKYFKLKDLKFNNLIQQYPLLLTDKNQNLNIHYFEYGSTKIENLNVNYQIKKNNKAFVNNLKFNYEKAFLSAEAFKVNLLKRKMDGFKLKISQFDLEKVLKIPLGEAVTAHGILDGFLNIDFNGDIPLFTGQLNAQKNGWIRYRKSFLSVKALNTLSANPMDILNSYLYDFYYDSLDLDFSSEPNYDLTMTLRTLGKNPQYLKGKPLKLNLKLEQNLLAAFKAMMLTYDMPKRIQEKIEEMGEK